ncbi:class I SAM-dependent methyltransferase [Croceicoccus mobilis]|uniref:Methyltransferase n=1 Tax=Croceicoccus mobilis TaxID=1703339 RepID=A0A916YTZ6_9SPHN|nr:class I SAM-dependent methyltransferase [Croceicoccus mobilis]GGD60343.1 methyltransferase [Croceicoccus mobilis]
MNQITRILTASLLAGTALAACSSAKPDQTAEASPAADEAISADQAITLAVASEGRPAGDKERDEDRKPAITVAFAGVKPGDTVIELMPGGGYYTRILAETVGETGKVIMVTSPGSLKYGSNAESFEALQERYPNVTGVITELVDFKPEAPADLIWTTENYHDLHNGSDVAAINAVMFDALKPGGLYFVEDHSAPGTGTSATDTIHRIDPAAVKEEVEAAGFTLDAESDHLANPGDPHDIGPFDPSIEGKTDRFALRFKKPE